MSILFFCKFDESRYRPDYIFPISCLWETKGQETYVKSPIRPKIELVQDFMAVLITCKSNEDSKKNEIDIVRATFSEVYGVPKG